MKTTYIKISDKSKLPKNTTKNITRQNLFGCLYTDVKTKELKIDKGILERLEDVRIFKEKLDAGFMELLNETEIEFTQSMGTFTFNRKANLTVYYIHMSANKLYNYEGI